MDVHAFPIAPDDARDLAEIASARFDLLPALTKIRAGEDLSESEYIGLSRAPLSLLAKLAELSARRSVPETIVSFRPVFYLPLAEWIEKLGEHKALERARDECSRIAGPESYSTYFVAIDRWIGEFLLETLLRSVAELHGSAAVPGHQLSVVGPSATELAEIRDWHAPDGDAQALASTLHVMRSYGVRTIDGGTDLSLHEFAALRGFACAVGHDVSALIEAAVHDPAAIDLDLESSARPLEERFIFELLDARARIGITGNLAIWFPWFRSAMRQYHRTTDEALGAPLLRILTLARIVLGSQVAIRAPISLFGRNLAQVALHFGVTDVGYVALNAAAAENLGVPRLSELSFLAAPIVPPVAKVGNQR